MSKIAEQILDLVESEGFSTFGWQGDPFTQAGRASFDAAMAANRSQKIERIERLILNSPPPQQEQAAPGAVQDGWQPIETAPKNGTPHLRGLHVYNSAGDFIYWDCHAGRINDETGEFEDLGREHTGWDADDYTHWAPLLPGPSEEKDKS